LKIREIRQFAERELAGQFDLRAFHDKLLSLGSVPLSILESEMRAWVSTQKATQKKGGSDCATKA